MSTTSLSLDDALQRYVLDVSLREPEVCRRLRNKTLQMEQSNMLSSPEQVQLLLLLAKMLDAERGLEVGTFTGYTSLRLTLGMPKLRMICCDTSDEYTAIARDAWRDGGVDDRIDLRLAPALETLAALLDDGGAGKFDFAYIDADKTSYRAYVERCEELVRPGGLIAIDNTLWSGAVIDPEDDSDDTQALRDLNQWLHVAADERWDLSLVPIGDGLTLLRRTS